jgi:hypothetical protein
MGQSEEAQITPATTTIIGAANKTILNQLADLTLDLCADRRASLFATEVSASLSSEFRFFMIRLLAVYPPKENNCYCQQD